MGQSGSTSADIQGLTGGLHEAYREKRRSGEELDTIDRCRFNYGREGKYLFPESLQPNDYYANSRRLDRQLTNGHPAMHITVQPGQPHYSKIHYPVDIRHEVSGLTRYLGLRPYRCADRIQDWIDSSFQLRYSSPALVWKCLRSEVGEEPDDPYTSLGRHDVEFFADRKQRGNMRVWYFETYPFKEPTDPLPAEGPPPVLPEVPYHALTPQDIADVEATYRRHYPNAP